MLVNFARNWYGVDAAGGLRLYKTQNNPHTLDSTLRAKLPQGAVILDDAQSKAELRRQVAAAVAAQKVSAEAAPEDLIGGAGAVSRETAAPEISPKSTQDAIERIRSAASIETKQKG